MKRMWLVMVCLCVPGWSATLTVDDDGPADFNSLSAAVAAAKNHDLIVLADGTYSGPKNRNITLSGKSLTIQSQSGPQACIIDCQSSGRAFTLTRSSETLTLNGVTLQNGYSDTASTSGGIYCLSRSNLYADNCVFSGCWGSWGGAVCCDQQANATFHTCTFFSNNGSEYGGALLVGTGCAMTVDNCIFNGNTAAVVGGAITCWQQGTLTVTNSYFIDNDTDFLGGGLFVFLDGKTTVDNSVFTTNHSAYSGGAISTYYAQTSLFRHCTFVNNTAAWQGSAFHRYYQSYPTVQNCIFSGHSGFVFLDESETSTPMTIQNCLFHDHPDGIYYKSFTGSVQLTVEALNQIDNNTLNIEGDPNFALPSDFHLCAGSAAIDTGQMLAGLQTDIEGTSRPIDGDQDGAALPDIGAYELNPQQIRMALSLTEVLFTQDPNNQMVPGQAVTLRNCGDRPLHCRFSTEASWVQVTPDELTLSPWNLRVVDIGIDASSLDRGIFQTVITVSEANDLAPARTIQVQLLKRGTLFVPEQWSTIQAAINAAMAQETIVVSGGRYGGGIQVDKPLALVGLDNPIIDGNGIPGPALTLNASNCLIQGFQFSEGSTGLKVTDSGSTITQNVFTNNATGLALVSGGYHQITNNQFIHNQTMGLQVTNSVYNNMSQNQWTDNVAGFDVTGSNVSAFYQFVDQSNTVDGKPIVYLMNSMEDILIPPLDPACVYLVNCQGVILVDLILRGNGKGVSLIGCQDCALKNIQSQDNTQSGLFLMDATGNAFVDNRWEANRNGLQGINSSSNAFRGNQFYNNDYGVVFSGAGSDPYEQAMDSSNTIDGKPILYLKGISGASYDANTDAAMVIAVDCSDLHFEGFDLSHNSHGLVLVNTHNTTITNLQVNNNLEVGIILMDCTNVTLQGVVVRDNPTGLRLQGTDGITLLSSRIERNHLGLDCYDAGDLYLKSTMVVNNQPSGGINVAGSAQVDIERSTLAYNILSSQNANLGGGVVGSDMIPIHLDSSIVWGNLPGQLPASRELVVTSCCIAGGAPGRTNITDDPLLSPDGHLTADSPCINRSSSSTQYADVDGEAAIGIIDIGADEFVDSNHDRLPDIMETLLQAAGMSVDPQDDPDGDGVSSLAEYE